MSLSILMSHSHLLFTYSWEKVCLTNGNKKSCTIKFLDSILSLLDISITLHDWSRPTRLADGLTARQVMMIAELELIICPFPSVWQNASSPLL